MKKFISPLLMLALATFVMVPGWAQAHSEGFYISGDLGVNIASGIDITGFSNDRSSVCDEFINPNFDTVNNTPGYEGHNCTGPNRGAGDAWKNQFDGATGILAGGAIGYSFSGHIQNKNSPLGGLRVELEYFYRQTNYDQTVDTPGTTATGVDQEKLQGELAQATDRFGSMTSHNLFGNLLYDFRNASRFTPYIGIGGGVGFTDVEHGSVWARNNNSEYITTGDGLPNAAEIQRNLAGTVSVSQNTLSDTLYGLQILFGVDYAITEAVSLGLKGRWVRFGSFRDETGIVWDPLRSHEPNLRKDGSEPVRGGLETNNIEFFGVSVNLKHRF